MGIVEFDYAAFIARYPEFASVSGPLAAMYFSESCMYCDNTDTSIVPAPDPLRQPRTMLLNMLTAHIAKLNFPMNGQPAQELVGRISNAGEGSVNVQAQMDYPPGSPQWFMQTKYGAAFWQATVAYRSMLYVPGHPRVVDPFAWPRRFYGGG